MESFTHVGLPCRVIHGPGRVKELPMEIESLGAKRCMFCCTKSRRKEVEKLASLFPNLVAGICDSAKIFVPIEAVEISCATAKNLKADCLISYGGGTAVGLAKATALELGIPIISIVTTYSGSETTSLQGIIGRDGKRTNYDDIQMLPKVIIYDPELTIELPIDKSVVSGFNSISHAVSSFLGKYANPISHMYSESGIRGMASAITKLRVEPQNITARSEAMHGAWLCGMTIMSSGTTIHHKITHVLGGGYNLSHGATHAIILPHSTSYNREVAPEAMLRIARALGNEAKNAPQALYELLSESGAPSSLRELGMQEKDLEEASNRIMTDRYFNIREYEQDAIRILLQDAWEGKAPSGI